MTIDEILNGLALAIEKNNIKFPTPPDFLMKINSVAKDPSFNIQDMVKVIQLNQVITARILQIANSPALNTGSKIESLNNAATQAHNIPQGL